MRASTLRFYKERMLRVLVHIQGHLDEPLSLEKLAALACLSPYHFHHVFTGMLGESLASHIRRLRLERAAWRLKLSRMPVVEIALEAGYGTHEAFSRAFRDCFQMSPTAFRRRNVNRPRIHVSSGVHYRADGTLKRFRASRTGDKNMKVTIKRIEPMRVAFMRHTGPYSQVGGLWEEFMMILGKDGWLGGDAQFIGMCHDDPAVTPPDKIRYDACMTVDDRFRAQGDTGVQTIPGGDYAVMTHLGPYEKLSESYAALLGRWLPRSGRNLRAAPCFEVYLNSLENTEPEDLVTDLYAPLEPARGGRHAHT
ncbi:MAG TPA: AraC family transcriptional regulator [Verrucomicrobiae bacterium]|nr:AraC family transcriptional regulator [Verrucomicrobiae bacterium]